MMLAYEILMQRNFNILRKIMKYATCQFYLNNVQVVKYAHHTCHKFVTDHKLIYLFL